MAQEKTACIYKRSSHKDVDIAHGGKHAISRRSLTHSTNKLCSEGNPVTAFILTGSDGRWKLLTPLFTPVQSSEWRTDLNSGTLLDVPVSSAIIFFQVDLHQEQMIHPTECTGSPNSFLDSSYSTEKCMSKSHIRRKRSKSLKSSSNDWLQNCFLPSNSSDSTCDGSSPNVSEILGVDIPKVDKPLKRNPRKKGKRKSKKYKRSSHRKGYAETEINCERSFCETPSLQKSSYVVPSCSHECMSGNNCSQNLTSSVLQVQISDEKSDGEENSSNFRSHSVKHLTDTSCNNEMYESGPTISLSEDYRCNRSDQVEDSLYQNCSSVVAQTPDMMLSIFEGNQSNAHLCKCVNTGEAHQSKSLSSTEDVIGRADCFSQACSINNLHTCIPSKSSRRGRKRPGNSNGVHRFGSTSINGGTGKETNTVWHRVQKKDVEQHVFRSDNSNPPSPQDMCEDLEMGIKNEALLLSEIDGNVKPYTYPCLEETSACFDSNKLQCKSDVEKLMKNVPEKLKTKPGSVSKKDLSYPRKGSKGGKTGTTKQSEVLLQKDEALDKSFVISYKKCDASNLRSTYINDLRKAEVSLIDKADLRPSESQEGTELLSPGHMCCPLLDVTAQSEQDQFTSFPKKLETLEQKCLHEVHSNIGDYVLYKDRHHSGHLAADVLDIEGLRAEHGKQNYCSEPVMPNTTLGGKDASLSNTALVDKFLSSIPNESVPDRVDSMSIEIDKQGPNTTVLCTTGSVEVCSSLNSETVPCSVTEDGLANKPRDHPLCMSSEVNGLLTTSSCLKAKDCCTYGLETDLDKIVKVVNDAYRLQTASEGVHLLTGSPVAEFERILHSASPVIGQMHYLPHCKSCVQDQLVGNSLCQHQIPDISLGNLWRWYEKPGSYGLEVKVGDHCTKKLGNDHSEFRAYFVPYLSAVQIFGRPKSSVCSSIRYSNFEGRTNCEVDEVWESSSSAAKGSCNQSPDSSWQGDNELLFEYFECEPPQQRRPLFEKIKELVKGGMFSNSQQYGDPSLLEHSHLNDIHPASWFSVAWYPIYRIPDGNLRAAFLTYHSLGNLIRRNSESKSGGSVRIVSPVVGLQSYNSKGECWFKQRDSKSEATEAVSSLNPSEILRERLRTLEQAASVMARASVQKGDCRSVNRDPDYEFFLSRRW